MRALVLLSMLAAFVLSGCRSDSTARSEPAPSGVTGSATASANTPASVAASTRASAEASDRDVPPVEARRARPAEIAFTPLRVFPGVVEVERIANGVIVCDPKCSSSDVERPRALWFVDRTHMVEDPGLEPWSDGVHLPRTISFVGRYPDRLHASLRIAGDRIGFSLDLAYDGKLWHRAPLPRDLAMYPVEMDPPSEVLDEVGRTAERGKRRRIAWGADGPTMVLDEGQAFVVAAGARRPLSIREPAAVHALHRLENGYTLVGAPGRIAILDRAGASLPLRVEGTDLPKDLGDVRFGNVMLRIGETEAWVTAVVDADKASARTVLLVAPPGLLSLAHLRRIEAASTVDLLSGAPVPFTDEWKASPPPRGPAPKNSGETATPGLRR